MTTTFLLIRHAETQWNREHRIQGFLNSDLSQEGRRQAERLGRRLRSKAWAAVYSSDAGRCLDTARLALQGTGLHPIALKDLRERNLGHWEGKIWEHIVATDPEGAQRYKSDPSFSPAQGESWLAMQERVMRAVNTIAAEQEGSSVLLFTSGGPVKAALLHVMRIPPETWPGWMTWNTGVTQLEKRKDGRWRVLQFNDVGHLSSSPEKEAGELNSSAATT